MVIFTWSIKLYTKSKKESWWEWLILTKENTMLSGNLRDDNALVQVDRTIIFQRFKKQQCGNSVGGKCLCFLKKKLSINIFCLLSKKKKSDTSFFNLAILKFILSISYLTNYQFYCSSLSQWSRFFENKCFI